MNLDTEELVSGFEAMTLDPESFGHYEHVVVAFELLGKYRYLDAVEKYAKSIEAIARAADAPEKFNLTITVAFLSLIAERRRLCPVGDFESFIEENNDLLDSSVLLRWYSTERLLSAEARQQFLLPDQGAQNARSTAAGNMV